MSDSDGSMSGHERHPLVEAMAVTGRLPRAEIAAAIEDQAEEHLVFFSLHILAVARQPRLHGPLMRLLHRPAGEVDQLLGTAETETLDAIIAGAFNGHAEDLFDLARDPERDEFLRGSVMAAIAILTWNGRIDAAVTRDFLKRFDDDRVIEAGDNGWFAWSYIVEQLGWTDFVPRVEQAYADGRIWAGLSTIETFRRGLAETLKASPDDGTRFRHGTQGYLTDALEELEHYNFSPVEPRPKSVPAPPVVVPARAAQSTEPVRNTLRHVGRNDPCPCGSGKKYKKCCLAA
jgi:hypothetical protein